MLAASRTALCVGGSLVCARNPSALAGPRLAQHACSHHTDHLNTLTRRPPLCMPQPSGTLTAAASPDGEAGAAGAAAPAPVATEAGEALDADPKDPGEFSSWRAAKAAAPEGEPGGWLRQC